MAVPRPRPNRRSGPAFREIGRSSGGSTISGLASNLLAVVSDSDGTSLLQTRMRETPENRRFPSYGRRQETSELRCKPTECVAAAAADRTVQATVRSANLMARTQSISIAPGVRFFRPLRSCLGFADRARWRPNEMTALPNSRTRPRATRGQKSVVEQAAGAPRTRSTPDFFSNHQNILRSENA